MMKAFVECVVKQLVDYPDEVVVTEVAGSQTAIYELRVNPADVSKVIGKQGRNIMAIRSLLESIGARHRKRAHLEIIEPANRAHPKRDAPVIVQRPTPATDWTPQYNTPVD